MNSHKRGVWIPWANNYHQYLAAGVDIRNAKDFNTVIGPYFFEIPLNQVCYMLPNAKSVRIMQVSPPGLHIRLGIFYRLFTLLEMDCHKLHLCMARLPGGERIAAGPSFEDHIALLQERQKLQEKGEV